MRLNVASMYGNAASSGRLYTSLLKSLRGGNTDKAIAVLDSMLDSELATLSTYEDVTPKDQRDRQIYDAVAVMRAYRTQTPSAAIDGTSKTLIDRGLALTSDDAPKRDAP